MSERSVATFLVRSFAVLVMFVSCGGLHIETSEAPCRHVALDVFHDAGFRVGEHDLITSFQTSFSFQYDGGSDTQ